jgi:hypothetical protein
VTPGQWSSIKQEALKFAGAGVAVLAADYPQLGHAVQMIVGGASGAAIGIGTLWSILTPPASKP